MLSYWEKQSFTNFDHAIIGGGIVGLSTALSLREKDPDGRIILLERGLRPTGASTRNAGFACFGSASELLEDLETLGENDMLSLVEHRWTGLQKLRQRAGDERLGFENYGGYEVLENKDMGHLDKLEKVNKLLYPLFKQKVFSDASDKIDSFGFSRKHAAGMIYNPLEAQLDTGKMMRTLWDMAMEKNIHIITGAMVKKYTSENETIRLTITGSLPSDKMNILVRKVAVCTNAFTRAVFPEVALYPGRGQVLLTSPIPSLKFKGAFHMERGFYYFRNVGNRVLFGGGRHLQLEEETTTEFGENQVIREKLEFYLREMILPGISYTIDESWSGIMAFGKNKIPYIKEHKPNIYLGVRLGGMGVAIGTHVGEKLAEMMTGV